MAEEPRNLEVEKRIIERPDDREAWAVLADWLQERGSPRGQLISLDLQGKHAEAKAYLEQHLDFFLGPLAAHRTVYDEGGNNSIPHLRKVGINTDWEETNQEAFLWQYGFIRRVRLSHDSYSHEDFDGDLAEILSEVLDHPSARFVSEFAFQSNGDPNEDDLQSLLDVLAEKAPLSTRKLVIGDNVDQISWHHTGSLAKLWSRVPNLREVQLESGDFDTGPIHAPSLERAFFVTGGLGQECARNIFAGTMPKLKRLEVFFGDDNYGGDCSVEQVVPFLARTDLPNLEYLGLKNAEFADDIVRALKGAPVLRTVKTLDLSLGVLTDDGAAALLELKDELKHLECLDVSENFMTLDAAKRLEGLCPKVLTDKQKTGDYRYVSIAE